MNTKPQLPKKTYEHPYLLAVKMSSGQIAVTNKIVATMFVCIFFLISGCKDQLVQEQEKAQHIGQISPAANSFSSA